MYLWLHVWGYCLTGRWTSTLFHPFFSSYQVFFWDYLNLAPSTFTWTLTKTSLFLLKKKACPLNDATTTMFLYSWWQVKRAKCSFSFVLHIEFFLQVKSFKLVSSDQSALCHMFALSPAWPVANCSTSEGFFPLLCHFRKKLIFFGVYDLVWINTSPV